MSWRRITSGCGRGLSIVILLATVLLTHAACQSATLMRNGQAVCHIVTSAQPDEHEMQAAEELAHYLEKMSGAKVMVLAMGGARGDGTPIYLGAAATAAMPDLNVERALANVKDELSSKEGFVIRVTDNAVALAGPTSRGTLNAAYELLERLGVRWYYPGELGENVPANPNVSLMPFEDVQIPSFDLRTMWFSGSGGSDDKEAIGQWMNRLRAGGFDWGAQHNMDGIDAPNDENVQKLADRIIGEMDASPNIKVYSLGWHDGYAHVTPEQAMGVQHPWHTIAQASDPLIDFYNKVITIVEQKHPGKRYGFLCYMNYLPAPFAVKAHPALQPVIAPIEQCPRHAPGTGTCWQRDLLLESIRVWCEMTPNAMIYDYEPGFLIDNDMPIPCVTRMRTEYPLWHQAGLRGLYCQAQMSVANNGPNLYVRMKLAWDVNADVGALLDDYFHGLYGPAGKAAQTYWMALEEMMAATPGHQHEDEILKTIYPINTIRQLESFVEEAEQLVNTSVLKDRVKALRFGHDNLMAYLELREAEDEGRFADAARLAHESWRRRAAIEAFNTNFVSIGDLDRTDDDHPHLILGMAKQNEQRAGCIDGTMGELVAMLPDEMTFRLDPANEGLGHRWFEPQSWPGANDRVMRTTRIWEVQGLEDEMGHGYDGVGWYAVTVEVPAEFAGRTIQLNHGGVFGSMLIWVNGEFAQHVPYRVPWWQNAMNPVIDVDLTKVIKPGQKNTIVIRLDNEVEWGGIFRRMFLWSPTQAEARQ